MSLVGGESDFAKKLAKTVLIQFLNERLGKPLRDFGREGEELVCALQEAEDARLVRLKAVSH